MKAKVNAMTKGSILSANGLYGGLVLTWSCCRSRHSIDKTVEERAISAKTSRAFKTVANICESKGILNVGANRVEVKSKVHGDWDLGIVRFIDPLSGKAYRIFEIPRGCDTMRVSEDAYECKLDARFAEHLPFINYG